MAPRVESDPVLAILERAPVVPLTEQEELLLAEVEGEPERRIAHADVESQLRARDDAA